MHRVDDPTDGEPPGPQTSVASSRSSAGMESATPTNRAIFSDPGWRWSSSCRAVPRTTQRSGTGSPAHRGDALGRPRGRDTDRTGGSGSVPGPACRRRWHGDILGHPGRERSVDPVESGAGFPARPGRRWPHIRRLTSARAARRSAPVPGPGSSAGQGRAEHEEGSSDSGLGRVKVSALLRTADIEGSPARVHARRSRPLATCRPGSMPTADRAVRSSRPAPLSSGTANSGWRVTRARRAPRPKWQECPSAIGPVTGRGKRRRNSPCGREAPSSPDLRRVSRNRRARS